MRGPDPSMLGIALVEIGLRAWTADNLQSYWARWVRRAHRPGRLALWTLRPVGVVWGVLGVTRLHYTLTTAAITSKSRAFGHGIDNTFDARWHRILREAARIRRTSSGPPLYCEPVSRRRDALGFVQMVIEDAERRLTPRVRPLHVR